MKEQLSRRETMRFRGSYEPNLFKVNGNKRISLFAQSVLVLGFLANQPVQATDFFETLKPAHPYARIGITNESNLFKLPPELERSDTYYTLAAGLDTEFTRSNQRFSVDAEIFRNLYDRFDQLDHTGGYGRVLWDWEYGKLWDGKIGYRYDRRLRSFENQAIPRKDLRSRHNIFGEANRWLSNRWRAGVNADWADITFSETERLDKKRTSAGARIDYVTFSENSLGMFADWYKADRVNAPVNDYHGYEIGPAAKWTATEKTRIRASLPYVTRRFDQRTARDFEGLTGDLKIIWDVTEKTSIDFSAWRRISNLEDEISNYAIVDGVSVKPEWAVTEKTSLLGVAGYERRDFEGESDAIDDIGLEERLDKVWTLGVWAEWSPRPLINLSVGYVAEQRNSNRELRDFDNNSIEAQIRVGL